MFAYSSIFCYLIVWLMAYSRAQYHIHHTDLISHTDLYYDCLYYKVLDSFLPSNNSANMDTTVEQVIPYCIRPLNVNERSDLKITRDSISSNLTFDELKEKNITIQQLLSWLAPIDLIELYQTYLNTPTLALASEVFHNCTLLWFGPFCQYTFYSHEPFADIVYKTFTAKKGTEDAILVTTITNLSCYVHVQCNRGPAPLCLDWREICDGRIDCLGDGIDEKQCIDLEINECKDDEYRCHNGMCIPEQFMNDNPSSPDCLDHTDEYAHPLMSTLKILGFSICSASPSFLCEESDPFDSYRGFVCGDGQYVQIIRLSGILAPLERDPCYNGRHYTLIDSVLTHALRSSHLTSECEFLMWCISFGRYSLECIENLCQRQGFPCTFSIERVCKPSKYVMLPIFPLLQAHAQFGYWTNSMITYESLEAFPIPNFVCFDQQRCPFLTSSFMVGNLSCMNLAHFDIEDLIRMLLVFDSCSLGDQMANQTGCFHPTLFLCPVTLKCISKHRLLDGILDCIDIADQIYLESCHLNHRHRFRCESENKCISPVTLHDNQRHCIDGTDEIPIQKRKILYQHICDGYIDLPAEFTDRKNETDETNCEQWPCINPYTRCDGTWSCSNGADEVNCNSSSQCPPNHHKCISPSTFNVECLPIDRAGNGIVDCLGSTDEREHCRLMYPGNFWFKYRCWNETTCTASECSHLQACQFETKNSIPKKCEENEDMKEVLANLWQDFDVWTVGSGLYNYFVLHKENRFQLKASLIHLTVAENSLIKSRENITHIDSVLKVVRKEIDFRRAWLCNRGIAVTVGSQEDEECFCPPSYYGNRCQYQNERVSLTLQFHKECAPIYYGIYEIIVKLVDNDHVIHSYDQLFN